MLTFGRRAKARLEYCLAAMSALICLVVRIPFHVDVPFLQLRGIVVILTVLGLCALGDVAVVITKRVGYPIFMVKISSDGTLVVWGTVKREERVITYSSNVFFSKFSKGVSHLP